MIRGRRTPKPSEAPSAARRAWLATALAAPALRAAHAQRPPLRARLGYLGGSGVDDAVRQTMIDPLERGLRELGREPGQHVDIDYRFAQGQPERLPGLLAELLQLRPDLLLTAGPRPTILVRDVAATLPPRLPVVAVHVDDPVQLGVAESYARPGGRFTGLSAPSGILEKRLQLLKELLPRARAFAILSNPLTNPVDLLRRDAPTWERQLGVSLSLPTARAPDEFATAFEGLVRDRVDAIAILADATFYAHRAALGTLCERHSLPAVVGGRGYLDAVGVMSYQGDIAELFRRAASVVVKILDGKPAGDLPWEQSTKMELVVHAGRARALGLRVPQSVQVSADHVIN